MNNNIYIYDNTPPIPPANIAGPVTANQVGNPPNITLTFVPPNVPAGLLNNTQYIVCSGRYDTAANPGYEMTWNAANNQFS